MVVLLTQLVSPLWITSKKASCDTWDAVYESLEYEEEEFKRDGSKADEGEQWISFNGTKPSDNPADYVQVILNFEVQNLSLWNRYIVNATLEDATAFKERILIASDADVVVTEVVNPLKNAEYNVLLTVYKEGLSEEQLRELVRGIKIKVMYKGEYFGTYERELSYSDCSEIKFSYSDLSK